ncbi:MAG: hypothetical protein AB7S38_22320 [Vulcanimicrobiota bacterium]
MKIQPNGSTTRPVMITARFDVTDEDTRLEPIWGAFATSSPRI